MGLTVMHFENSPLKEMKKYLVEKAGFEPSVNDPKKSFFKFLSHKNRVYKLCVFWTDDGNWVYITCSCANKELWESSFLYDLVEWQPEFKNFNQWWKRYKDEISKDFSRLLE